jgi:hypothetical protein
MLAAWMRRRHRLGSPHTDESLDAQGVQVAAIPFLKSDYRVINVRELGIGGAAPKDFVVCTEVPNFGLAYVAKKPSKSHSGYRECVVEYLISRIGRELPLRVAEGRLARLRVPHGEPDDVRFMSRYFLRHGQQSLLHGVELVAQAYGVTTSHVAQQAKEQRHESQFYTVQMIDDVLGEVSQSNEVHLRLRASFARMMAFDALVGANDRHAENWGAIEDVRNSRLLGFAPIYDTARGLLLRLSDEQLMNWYASDPEQELAKYAQRSVSLIGTGAHERSNHFEVFRHMVSRSTLSGCGVPGGSRLFPVALAQHIMQ